MRSISLGKRLWALHQPANARKIPRGPRIDFLPRSQRLRGQPEPRAVGKHLLCCGYQAGFGEFSEIAAGFGDGAID